MARRQADARLAALSRRRPDTTTEHFGLSMIAACVGGPGQRAAPVLGLSVPKRLLPLAVDRNAVKRVAREAWRLTPWPPGGIPEVALIRLRRAPTAWREQPTRVLKRWWRAEIDLLIGRGRKRGAVGGGGER